MGAGMLSTRRQGRPKLTITFGAMQLRMRANTTFRRDKMAKIAKKIVGQDMVTFAFADGKEQVCKLKDLPPGMLERMALHGIAQKVGDSYSGVDTVSEGRKVASETWKNLMLGNFNARVSGSGSVLVEALARLKKVSIEEIQDALEGLDDEARKALEAKPQVRAMVGIIRGERAQAKLSILGEATDDLNF